MENFFIILICIISGLLFKKYNLVPKDAHKGINTWILYIALPAVSFKYIPHISWSWSMLFPALSAFIVFIGAYVFVSIYCKYKNYSSRTKSSLLIANAFSNTSFIGFPLIMAYYDAKDLSIAIICDQVMFVLLSSLGIIIAMKGNPKETSEISPKIIFKKLVSFPPFIGCLCALVLSQFFDLNFATPFFDKLAATVGPLALFSVGLQLTFKGWQKTINQISFTLCYKLLIGPALVLCCAILCNISGSIGKISVFEAAMPTLVTGSLIAEQYNLNVKLVNLIIGVGILFSFISTAIWYFVLAQVF
ncbi:MAG: AEC family transporter [Flavobacterium sp.]|nr:AEC family transporter [Candidatus Neoflavobacterium equi]